MKGQSEIVYLPKFHFNCDMSTSDCDVIDCVTDKIMTSFDIICYAHYDYVVKHEHSFNYISIQYGRLMQCPAKFETKLECNISHICPTSQYLFSLDPQLRLNTAILVSKSLSDPVTLTLDLWSWHVLFLRSCRYVYQRKIVIFALFDEILALQLAPGTIFS